MLTGDSAGVANAVASEIGINQVYAELMPQDKIDQVRALAGGGHLAMIGDGVNDAPALAAADIGIALGGQSSDTAMETADVVVMSPNLSKVADLIRLSRRCRSILKQNIGFALATKLAVMLLAAVGAATMWMAVASDVGASLLVIANGLRMIQRRRM
jgi:Cd2+/Zn2+-exporting ATPase